MTAFEFNDKFADRHIGPTYADADKMLDIIGVKSFDELIEKTIPAGIRIKDVPDIGKELSEHEYLKHIKEIAGKNKIFKSYIGLGYYETIFPAVIRRNIFENPGWYTQYTPYQAEISQGRLEAVLNFQTVVSDLTGLPLANASLLDEATAAAEAMTMLFSLRKKDKKAATTFLVDEKVFPHTIDVLQTRAVPFGINIKICPLSEDCFTDDVYGALMQYPDADGEVVNIKPLIDKAVKQNIYTAVATDLLALTLLVPPGEMGADVVVGTTQRFGIPMGYGGPHAAFFATKEDYKRSVPGRIIGVSVDSAENPALRMALQTREQHIKREKATSNICTAQVLLAIMAGMYAIYHGPKGLEGIARKINSFTQLIEKSLLKLGFKQLNKAYFDTIKIDFSDRKADLPKIKKIAEEHCINFRYFDNSVGISVGETISFEDVLNIVNVFGKLVERQVEDTELEDFKAFVNKSWADEFDRTSKYLTHPVFNVLRSETELLRYIKNLEKKDLSLTSSMIPLGSCTMKLNAATEMEPVSWPEFGNIHPFAPADQVKGYRELVKLLGDQLVKLTGFSGISFQPNSGAQGEYSGLMVIRAYHESRGEGHRNICLIPSSAHGTNPASAVMAGSKVVIVKCDEKGNIDVNDLKAKAEQHAENLSSLMVTYPSTHGVFEEDIKEICNIIHDFGGQVYMDGANLNAQVSLTNPGVIGADVCHLNLHKTFAIPHGGGGPGMGPIAVAEHLVPFLPNHVFGGEKHSKGISAVSAAPYGSASVLLISYAYIKMMGGVGLKEATENAILNANYIKESLKEHYPVLYTGTKGFVGHELIFDLRAYKASAGIEVEDVAKRLMDYGFHAPTVSFPVPGTLMVEPTESESKEELDRFCEAMITIRKEIQEIVDGEADKEDNVLKNAPHTSEVVISDEWNHSYSREKAAFPLHWVRKYKFWPSVGRVNNAYGDRNLVCSCLPVSAYEDEETFKI